MRERAEGERSTQKFAPAPNPLPEGEGLGTLKFGSALGVGDVAIMGGASFNGDAMVTR